MFNRNKSLTNSAQGPVPGGPGNCQGKAKLLNSFPQSTATTYKLLHRGVLKWLLIENLCKGLS